MSHDETWHPLFLQGSQLLAILGAISQRQVYLLKVSKHTQNCNISIINDPRGSSVSKLSGAYLAIIISTNVNRPCCKTTRWRTWCWDVQNTVLHMEAISLTRFLTLEQPPSNNSEQYYHACLTLWPINNLSSMKCAQYQLQAKRERSARLLKLLAYPWNRCCQRVLMISKWAGFLDVIWSQSLNGIFH